MHRSDAIVSALVSDAAGPGQHRWLTPGSPQGLIEGLIEGPA
jgi:hypothetical protein